MSAKVSQVDVAKQATEGDEITVEYDSAHADEVQTISGTVQMSGRTQNGGRPKVEFKNTDGVYRLLLHDDDEYAELIRLQFGWSNGERTVVEGRRRVTARARNPIRTIAVDPSETHTCWKCGEEFDTENDHENHLILEH